MQTLEEVWGVTKEIGPIPGGGGSGAASWRWCPLRGNMDPAGLSVGREASEPRARWKAELTSRGKAQGDWGQHGAVGGVAGHLGRGASGWGGWLLLVGAKSCQVSIPKLSRAGPLAARSPPAPCVCLPLPQVDPYLPYEYTCEGMLERIHAYIQHQVGGPSALRPGVGPHPQTPPTLGQGPPSPVLLLSSFPPQRVGVGGRAGHRGSVCAALSEAWPEGTPTLGPQLWNPNPTVQQTQGLSIFL